MAEVALRTTEEYNRKTNVTVWRPRGGVVSAFSDRWIRAKWIEIICDLLAPYKRQRFAHLPWAAPLAQSWTPQLRDAWRDWERGRWLLDGETQDARDAAFWTQWIEPRTPLDKMPKEPSGVRPIYEAVLWGSKDLMTTFAIVVEAPSDAVESMNGEEPRNEITGLVVPIDAPRAVIVPRRWCDYPSVLGLSQETLDLIADPSVRVMPRYDEPVAAKLICPLDAAAVVQRSLASGR